MINNLFPQNPGPIGVFDSGYGGLTILEKIRAELSQYDYIYLGDNARTPYGTRSFEVVYEYTLECVTALFKMGCQLVILACNTASAKALRTIQQNNLPQMDPRRRVLGVIRPTVEAVGALSTTKHIGLLATKGTVKSESYSIELKKLHPDYVVAAEACPMWVPLIENNEHETDGADFFIKKNVEQLMRKDPSIDTIILGCTHYPIIADRIKKYVHNNIQIFSQGEMVAKSLADYMRRHPEIDELCTKRGSCTYYTTDSEDGFTASASIFLNESIVAHHLDLG